MKILLFDIDGTLLFTGGAGLRSMTRAFEQLFGIPNALEGITLSGMTDPVIFKNACRQVGIEYSPAKHQAFKERYLELLQEEIEQPHPDKRLLPGVPELLDALIARSDVHLGLLTGNYQQGARIKLGHFNLNHYFKFGAFGDDHCDRDQLLPFALKRFQQLYAAEINGGSVFVIGDTPRDVACARPHGARSVAVATGDYSIETLKAAGADTVLADLTDIEAFLALLEK